MRLQLSKLIICLLFLLLNTILSSGSSIKKLQNNADKDYAIVNHAYEQIIIKVGEKNSTNYLNNNLNISIEKQVTRYLNLGLDFYKKYPHDNRKWKWFELFQVLNVKYCHFWKNIDSAYITYKKQNGDFNSYIAEVNWESYNEWKNELNKIKFEYPIHLNYNPPISRNTLLLKMISNEILHYIEMSRNKIFRKSSSIDLSVISNLIYDLNKTASCQDCSIEEKNSFIRYVNVFTQKLSYDLLSRYKGLGLSTEEISIFLNSLSYPSDHLLYQWSIQAQNLFNLYYNPLTLIDTTLGGKIIDLNKFRNKSVVLLDFWSLGCSGCIIRMPYLHKIYEKYRNKGFTVISACFSSESKIDQIKAIQKRLNLQWNTVILGSTQDSTSNSYQLMQKYGFNTVPKILLLNKEGKMALFGNELLEGDIEKTVTEMLEK